MSKNSGGPAFPIVMDDRNADYTTVEWGMSMRDWFAGMALQGMLTCPDTAINPGSVLASIAYAQADSMLAERNKP